MAATLRLFTETIADQKNKKPRKSRTEIKAARKQDIEPEPVSFGDTIRALVSLYRRCEHDGAVELARRAQRALVVLLGPQPHLKADDDGEAVMGVAEHTLRGLGGGS